MFEGVFEGLGNLIYYLDLVLVQYFGWVLFLWLFIWLSYWVLRLKNTEKFVSAVKWVFLEVRVDELNERSPFAMEQVFAALHAINTSFTFGEQFNGNVVLWMSCEIVSLGGRVSFIFKIPERYRNLLESAIFAQYPKAEVYEVEDYLKNLPREFNPDTSEFDIWGSQINKRKGGAESCFPIRTFAAFEHTEQETIIDPLANVLEVMSNIQPYELLATQIVLKPIGEDWKPAAYGILDKLKGKPKKEIKTWFDTIFIDPIKAVTDPFFDLLIPPPEKKEKEAPPSLMQHLSEGEKGAITAAERMLSKISYEVRVRLFYLAPKDKVNKSHVSELIGAYRNFDDPSLNGLKPDVSGTMTGATYRLSQTLEQPLIRNKILTKKRHMYHAFRNRSHWEGTGRTIMNPEELATIFHFPQVPNARVSQLEKVSTVKSAPPSDLPVG